MKTVFAIIAIITTCGMAVSAHAGCYTVYSSGKIVHQSSEAPVDTSPQFHRTIPQRFGQGASLVFVAQEDNCPPIGIPVQAFGSDFGQGADRNSRSVGRRPKAERG
ncbi:MAG: hypothetical protein JWR68_858 [Polaromonas sp.]|nr:hypothetical protein [Polaromonas sp.]